MAVRNLGEPLGEVKARAARVRHAEEHDLCIEGEHDPEGRPEIVRGEGRIHAADDRRTAADGREAVAVRRRPMGIGPATCSLGDRPHLGRIAGRIDDRVVLGFVGERVGRDDEGPAGTEDVECGVDHGVGTAVHPAERPHRGVDEGDLPVRQPDRAKPGRDLVPGQPLVGHTTFSSSSPAITRRTFSAIAAQRWRIVPSVYPAW